MMLLLAVSTVKGMMGSDEAHWCRIDVKVLVKI